MMRRMLPRLGSGVRIPSPAPFSPFNQACMAGRSRRSPARGASLADVKRMPVLQVEMQMGAVDVVGFWTKHRGEHLTGALMNAPEELGLRQRQRILRWGLARGPRVTLDKRSRLDRSLHRSLAARRLCRHLVGRRGLIGFAVSPGVLGDDRDELRACYKVTARRAPASGKVDSASIGKEKHRKVDRVGIGVLAAALIWQIVEIAASIAR